MILHIFNILGLHFPEQHIARQLNVNWAWPSKGCHSKRFCDIKRNHLKMSYSNSKFHKRFYGIELFAFLKSSFVQLKLVGGTSNKNHWPTVGFSVYDARNSVCCPRSTNSKLTSRYPSQVSYHSSCIATLLLISKAVIL